MRANGLFFGPYSTIAYAQHCIWETEQNSLAVQCFLQKKGPCKVLSVVAQEGMHVGELRFRRQCEGAK